MGVVITKQMYGWSKYGGARHGLAVETLDEWTCQLCGTTNTKALPSYFVSETSRGREFYRLCSVCKRKALDLHIDSFEELLVLKVANLASFPTRF